jgi:hypothetical protein
MHFSPVLAIHIFGGILGVVSGAVAVSFRKGSRPHALVGKWFVASMLCLGASGAYMAVLKFQPGNILGGIVTCYLVATSWMTVRRREERLGIFDWAAFVVVAAVAFVEVMFGLQAAQSPTGMKYGYPPGPYLFLGSVAVLAAVGDVRMFVRGGISGRPRLARHLWRMCFAFFIASASIFLARAHLFPVFMRNTGMLFLLSFMPLILMVFWLIRIRFRRPYRKISMPGAEVGSVPA